MRRARYWAAIVAAAILAAPVQAFQAPREDPAGAKQPEAPTVGSLVERHHAAVKEAESFPGRLDRLEADFGAHTRALLEIQPAADAMLLKVPSILRTMSLSGYDPSGAGRQSTGDAPQIEVPPYAYDRRSDKRTNVTSEQLEAMSRAIWDHQPMADEWKAIRESDVAADFSGPRGRVARIAVITEELRPFGRTALDVAAAIAQGKTTLSEFTRLVESQEREVQAIGSWGRELRARIKSEAAVIERIAVAVRIRRGLGNTIRVIDFHPGIERELGLIARHRYAMVPRQSIFIADGTFVKIDDTRSKRGAILDLDAESPARFAWPVCDELFEAATNFDYWYAWATDAAWYGDNALNLRLDMAQWPKDAAKTRELHAEFALVVTWQHWLLDTDDPPDWDVPSKPWQVTTEEIWRGLMSDSPGSTRMQWNYWTHLGLYFGPRSTRNEYLEQTGQLIPAVRAAPPGRVLPPLR